MPVEPSRIGEDSSDTSRHSSSSNKDEAVGQDRDEENPVERDGGGLRTLRRVDYYAMALRDQMATIDEPPLHAAKKCTERSY